MAKSRIEKIQEMHRSVDVASTDIVKELQATVVNKIAAKGYRADLKLFTASKTVSGPFAVEVKFNASLGYPTEKDLMSLVAGSYPKHAIDWTTVEVDDAAGVIVLQLEPSLSVVPVNSISEIPSEYRSIGAGLYKRAANASGTVQEIWTLKKSDDGSLSLIRNQDDIEITAEEEGFKAGDVVNTPTGPGRLVRYDELGNALVQVGSKKQLVAASELQPYDLKKEKSKLLEYFSQLYGEEFAQKMVKEYGDNK